MGNSQHVRFIESSSCNDRTSSIDSDTASDAGVLHIFAVRHDFCRTLVGFKLCQYLFDHTGIAELDGVGDAKDDGKLAHVDNGVICRIWSAQCKFQIWNRQVVGPRNSIELSNQMSRNFQRLGVLVDVISPAIGMLTS